MSKQDTDEFGDIELFTLGPSGKGDKSTKPAMRALAGGA